MLLFIGRILMKWWLISNRKILQPGAVLQDIANEKKKKTYRCSVFTIGFLR
jgi:hypothetical protein